MSQYGRGYPSRVVRLNIGGNMKYLAMMGVLALGACVHGDSATAPVYNAQATVAPAGQMVTATCGESFNATVDHLVAAMNLDATYAFSEPVAEAPTAYDGRVSRF